MDTQCATQRALAAAAEAMRKLRDAGDKEAAVVLFDLIMEEDEKWRDAGRPCDDEPRCDACGPVPEDDYPDPVAREATPEELAKSARDRAEVAERLERSRAPKEQD